MEEFILNEMYKQLDRIERKVNAIAETNDKDKLKLVEEKLERLEEKIHQLENYIYDDVVDVV